MCTAMTLRSADGDNFFGRTMDFSYDIDPGLYVVPKNRMWRNVLNGNVFSDEYGFLAVGQETDGILGFFDGVNENGFAAAALYFPGFAQYGTCAEDPDKKPVASLDFLAYLLGRCGSVRELVGILPYLCVVGVPDPVTQIAAPLHWVATDRSGDCVVVEPTGNGLEVFENPIGVMTNSPGFQWHMTNLRNYTVVSAEQTEEVRWGGVSLKPFGQAAGTSPLPGGYAAPARFVRTAFQKTHLVPPRGKAETVVACFHVLSGVTVPKGVVKTERGTYDYTKYTAFVDTASCAYFFKTYDGTAITRAAFRDFPVNGEQPVFLGPLGCGTSFRSFVPSASGQA